MYRSDETVRRFVGHDVRIVRNGADGACFFHALSQILNNRLSHTVLRSLSAHMYLQMDEPLEYIANSGLLDASHDTNEVRAIRTGLDQILGDHTTRATCAQKHLVRKLLFSVYSDRNTFVDEPQVIYMQKLLHDLGLIIVSKYGRECHFSCTPIFNIGDTRQEKLESLKRFEQFALLLHEREHYEALMVNGKLTMNGDEIPNVIRKLRRTCKIDA
jgi:hypothetical protein